MFHIFDFVVIYLVFVEISNNTLEKLENIFEAEDSREVSVGYFNDENEKMEAV